MYSREQWIPSVAKTIKGQQCVRVAAILKRSLEFERTKGWITLTKWHDMRTLRGHALFPFEHDTRFFFRFKLEIWINRIFFFLDNKNYTKSLWELNYCPLKMNDGLLFNKFKVVNFVNIWQINKKYYIYILI